MHRLKHSWGKSLGAQDRKRDEKYEWEWGDTEDKVGSSKLGLAGVPKRRLKRTRRWWLSVSRTDGSRVPEVNKLTALPGRERPMVHGGIMRNVYPAGSELLWMTFSVSLVRGLPFQLSSLRLEGTFEVGGRYEAIFIRRWCSHYKERKLGTRNLYYLIRSTAAIVRQRHKNHYNYKHYNYKQRHKNHLTHVKMEAQKMEVNHSRSHSW